MVYKNTWFVKSDLLHGVRGSVVSASRMVSSSMFGDECFPRLELFSSQRNCVLGEQVLVSSVSNNIIVYNKS